MQGQVDLIQSSDNTTSKKEVFSIIDTDIFSNEPKKEEKKKFGFIKKTTNPSPLLLDPQPKETFSFIKKEKKNQVQQPQNQSKAPSGLDEIFSNNNFINLNSNDNVPTKDLTKFDDNKLDEIFGKKSNIDITKITNNYSEKFSNNEIITSTVNVPHQVDLAIKNQFNYDLVYDNIDGERKKPKDHFSFVNDMLKKK